MGSAAFGTFLVSVRAVTRNTRNEQGELKMNKFRYILVNFKKL